MRSGRPTWCAAKATMSVAVKDRATQAVTADQPARGGRWGRKTRKSRPKKRSMAVRLPSAAAVHVGGRQERSLVALGLKGMTATAPRALWIHASKAPPQ